MRPLCLTVVVACVALILFGAAAPAPVLKTESFDRDPNWDRSNNRPADRGDRPVAIRQDFGYSPRTNHAGGQRAGEVGGLIHAAAEPACYGKKLGRLTLDDRLSASGTLSVADGGTNLLLGFYNASTLNEWRTPNTLAIRINGRGEHFFAYLEYCTSKWRAGADSPRAFPRAADGAAPTFPSGRRVYRWSIDYDPAGNGGRGVITATVGRHTSVCELDEGHKADGATFDRFGLLNVMKSADDATEVFIDDVTINGVRDGFDADPGWDGRNNRASYQTFNVRPRFDFGFSPDTALAGGQARGELGGLIFRGDCRHPQRMAYCADRVGPLALDRPIRASGKVAMLRGVSDSTTMFGFFEVRSAMRSNPSQAQGVPEGMMGINIEGPSSEGFCFYPVYRLAGGDGIAAPARSSPRIYPDGTSHDWTFEYDPAGAGGRGRITVTLDGKSVSLDLLAGQKATATRFDRFGILTPWIDGNGQVVYLDDLTYTAR